MDILLVEDTPSDALLIRKALESSGEFQITEVERLSRAISALRERTFDVILLDLGLPDSSGLRGLQRLYDVCGETAAIVVLTGNDDESQGPVAVRLGAQDYLQKNHIAHPEVLRRCLIYANERCRHQQEIQKLQEQLEQARREEQRKRETDFWEKMAQGVPMNVSATMVGQRTLKEQYPEIFASLERQYARILDLSLEHRVKKVPFSVSAECEQLAGRLGFLKASPRDVVEIHRDSLKARMTTAASQLKANAFQEEARLRIVELMGFLAMYYRNQPLYPETTGSK